MDNKISFIYFDVGGVLMKDFSATNKWEELIKSWGVKGSKIDEVKKRFKEFEKEACVGRDTEDFSLILSNEFGVNLPKKYSILRNFVGRFERNEGIWKIVDDCRKKYRLGLLTNAYPGMFKLTKESGLLPRGDFLVIDSSVVKQGKPNEGIYKTAQERCGVEAKKILFIDNGEKNLEVPKKLGWKTFWYDSADYEQSSAELKKFLG